MNGFLTSVRSVRHTLVAGLAVVWVSLYALMPSQVSAQLVPPCGISGDCTACDLVAITGSVSEIVLYALAGVTVLTVVVAGIYWLTSTGNPEKVQRGKEIFIGSFTGVAITLGAYVIVNFVIQGLAGAANLSSPGVLFGNTSWSTYCTVAPDTVSSCTEAADGTACSVDGCDNPDACACYQGQCFFGMRLSVLSTSRR